MMLGCAGRVQRVVSGSPSLAAVARRDKTLNKVSNLGHGFIQTKVSNRNHQPKLIQLFGLKPNLQTTARQQAQRLRWLTYHWC